MFFCTVHCETIMQRKQTNAYFTFVGLLYIIKPNT